MLSLVELQITTVWYINNYCYISRSTFIGHRTAPSLRPFGHLQFIVRSTYCSLRAVDSQWHTGFSGSDRWHHRQVILSCGKYSKNRILGSVWERGEGVSKLHVPIMTLYWDRGNRPHGYPASAEPRRAVSVSSHSAPSRLSGRTAILITRISVVITTYQHTLVTNPLRLFT